MSSTGLETQVQGWVVFLLWLLPVVTAMIGVIIVQIVHVLQDVQAAQRTLAVHAIKLTTLQSTITNGGLTVPVKEAVKQALAEVPAPPPGQAASG